MDDATRRKLIFELYPLEMHCDQADCKLCIARRAANSLVEDMRQEDDSEIPQENR